MPEQESLIREFPAFLFAIDADRFLRQIQEEGLPLREQLRARHVSVIAIQPQISGGGIKIGEDDNFFIGLEITNTLLEKARSLGHEIGHTFHYDFTTIPPTCLFDPLEISAEVLDKVEDFCDEFSRRWLLANDQNDIILRVANTEKLIHQFAYIS